jgi:chromosomal replication initiation ATPase DnaA
MKPIGTALTPNVDADTVTFNCPSCGNTRILQVTAAIPWVDRRCAECADKEETELRARERENLIMGRLSQSNLPHNLRGKKLTGPLLQLAKAWAAPNPEVPMLTVYGPVGVGKTHFAAAAFRLALAERQVTWIEVARHMAMLQASFGDNERREAMRVFTGTGPAVFDDIDKIVEEKHGLPKLFAAIDTRIAHGSPVLVTMNSSLDEFRTKLNRKSELGDPIASRLAGGTIRKLTGPDRRTTR